ncbi:MAG: hypothetical protein FJX95_08930 [Bacteroidetes bacterium]|nr:hypothetical protein [Bacteroidota bacterium]
MNKNLSDFEDNLKRIFDDYKISENDRLIFLRKMRECSCGELDWASIREKFAEARACSDNVDGVHVLSEDFRKVISEMLCNEKRAPLIVEGELFSLSSKSPQEPEGSENKILLDTKRIHLKPPADNQRKSEANNGRAPVSKFSTSVTSLVILAIVCVVVFAMLILGLRFSAYKDASQIGSPPSDSKIRASSASSDSVASAQIDSPAFTCELQMQVVSVDSKEENASFVSGAVVSQHKITNISLNECGRKVWSIRDSVTNKEYRLDERCGTEPEFIWPDGTRSLCGLN